MSNQRKIIFLHLPKTGGTAVVNILHQLYGLENSALIAGDDDPALPRAIQENKDFVHGHFSAKVFDQVSGYYQASLLRDAGDRLISRYVHIAHSQEARLQKEFASYGSFQDFLNSSYADNWQCRMLAGIWHEGKVDESIYIRAVDRLYALDWVASAAQQPLATLDLSLKLGYESYYNPRLNTRASADMWRSINNQYRTEIMALNRFDEQLVKEAEALFIKRKSIPIYKLMKLKLKNAFLA